MTTKDEALKQLLEAWQTSVYGSDSHHKAMLLAMTNMAQALAAPVQEPVAGKGKELSEQLKLCARNVAFVAAGRVDMSSAAMQEMFALIDHVCVGLDSPPAQPEPMKGKS